MLVTGYLLALLMGMTLGVLGAGGSILTVPIWVYCFAVPPLMATGYSLGIVGSTALLGAWRYYRKGMVVIRAALLFILPAMLMVHLTRFYILPAIPAHPFGLFSKDAMIMVLFGLLMLAVSLMMLLPSFFTPLILMQEREGTLARLGSLLLGSATVGLVTGLVGAGGGFLIVPTLVGLFRLPVKQAVGTSLSVIALNALAGFMADLSRGLVVHWALWLAFLAVTLLGMLIGTAIASRLPAMRVQRFFGWFVLLVGALITADAVFCLIAGK
jgi:uncharacterized protein